ncbi:SAVED domain-containing protein [Teredinibacter turnerae]|uniref:SAVED domain-containing protein n=1 Tax=Teredinibacter turnerae TaxID=2426 RepID=UPI00035C289F|nr:SAVED domain-containing protein [Teredinibacter turnerae]
MGAKPARNIKPQVQNMLWGVAAGRCQFRGCNKPLWKNEATNLQANIAQKAHIWSFSDDGPRGNEGIAEEEINSIDNLMLVCHGCHKLIDDDLDGDTFSVQLLQDMKRQHEHRVELVTSIEQNMKSHLLLYGANIGDQGAVLRFENTAAAMIPDYYPASSLPLEISLKNSNFQDHDDFYWDLESKHLEKAFNEKVKPGISSGAISHLSIFGLAPQPLLMKLGSLLTDIPEIKVFQRHREPQTWKWQIDEPELRFILDVPKKPGEKIAFNLSLSASINNDRIYRVLGNDVSIWTLTVDSPHRDLIRTEAQLVMLREKIRVVLDQIKRLAGDRKVLHVFPAMPVSAAIEFGRVHMPKADLSLRIYDQSKKRDGFIKAVDIGLEDGFDE